jgi:hypothetical protein
MSPEMSLTDFRDSLTEVIDNLGPEPVRLTKYNDVVAEIRSAAPEAEKALGRAVLRAITYLNDLGITHLLESVGVDTLPKMLELADRHRELTDQGVDFDGHPEHALPGGPSTIDHILASLYFGDDAPKAADDTYPWFMACARLQAEAVQRGQDTELPCPNAYDEDVATFIDQVIASGYTPDALHDLGVKALDSGVALKDLLEMIGDEPIPADVLAHEHYREHVFSGMIENGMPHAEVVEVYRKGISPWTAEKFAEAGVRSADEIAELIDRDADADLALRAARNGLTAEEWKPLLPLVQRHKYEKDGLIDFRLLAEAAQEGLSLVHWDKNKLSLPNDQNWHSAAYMYDKAQRMATFPWSEVYPDRLLDAARAKIAPSYVTAFAKLMEHHTWSEDNFATSMITARQKGLTTDALNALTRVSAHHPNFTPQQLFDLLDLGLGDKATAQNLSDGHDGLEQWTAYLTARRNLQQATSAYFGGVIAENDLAWQSVMAVVDNWKRIHKSAWRKPSVLATDAAEKILKGVISDDLKMYHLLLAVESVLESRPYAMPQSWWDQHASQAPYVLALAQHFNDHLKLREEAPQNAA